MSFLDRLKREADQQRMQAEQTARERDERETRYRTQIEPKMKALTHYLEGLVATLQEVRPPILIRMPIQGYGELCAVPFWDYKVEPERRHRGYLLTMTWSLRVDPERTPVVRAEGVTRVKTLTNVFRQHTLAGIKEERRTPQGEISLATFHARGFVKARFTAQISADDPVLRLVFENASWLGSSRRQVNWEQIDDSLFDRIARFIVREDDSLFTEEVPDELKQRLRKEPLPTGGSAAASAPAPAAPQASAPSVDATPVAPSAAQPLPAPAALAPVVDAPAVDAPTSFIPGMIPAPAPVTEGEVIEIDESKLGLEQWHAADEDHFGAFSFPAKDRATATQPGISPAQVEPATQAAAPPAPVVPAATPPVPGARAAEKAAPTQPGISPAPVEPAARAAAPPAPVVPAATPPVPSARAPLTGASTSAPASVPAAPPPASPAKASVSAPTDSTAAGPATAPAAETAKSPAEEATEREAALFRLKVRAMLARMRTTDEPGAGES
ncbi:MAG: hypothetical protein IT479_15505 [Xanthomonadales bacterium]|nr:hypothetical protein [Xanthomonadales bacterium]